MVLGIALMPGLVEISVKVKCALDTSLASSIDELSDAHHHELVTAIELDDVTVSFVAVHFLNSYSLT